MASKIRISFNAFAFACKKRRFIAYIVLEKDEIMRLVFASKTDDRIFITN
jgi:hypothetical protein